MIIYGALFISLVAALVLYFYFKRETVWWEFAFPLVVSLIFIVLMKLLIEYSQVQSKEYWGSIVNRVEYYEDWNEYIHRTCTRSCGKNCTTTYDCSYVDYHPAYWQIVTTTGEVLSISESQYEEFKKLFANESFQDMHRSYYTDDGDEYYTVWGRDSVRAVPVTTTHSYENRIKASDQTVFHFEPVDTSTVSRYSLKDYPSVSNYKMNAVLGDNSPDAQLANKQIQYVNGLLGPKKEVTVFVLVFKDQPIRAATYQESYWSGGNKNEFVVCIGTDKTRNVQWCKVISWTTNEELKIEARNYVVGQKQLNLQALAGWLKINLDAKFVRRSFKEFDYITVEPPTWAIVLTYILTIALNIGVTMWIVRNEFSDDVQQPYYNRIRRW